jgi:hypothetical protein
MYLHFGLGNTETINSIEVLFPGGNTVIVEDIAADQQIWLHEDGSMETGELFPSHFLPPQSLDE